MVHFPKRYGEDMPVKAYLTETVIVSPELSFDRLGACLQQPQ